MFSKLIARLAIRHRLLLMVVLLLVIALLSGLMLVIGRNQLLRQQLVMTEGPVEVDRLVLLASARVSSSRVRVQQHDQGQSGLELALEDVRLAVLRLEQARGGAGTQQNQQIEELTLALAGYQDLIEQLQRAVLAANDPEGSRLTVQALARSEELADLTDRLVEENERVLAEARTDALQRANRTGTILGALYIAFVLLALSVAVVAARSITKRIGIVHTGIQSQGRGPVAAMIQVEGDDELSDLARSLNEMNSRLSQFDQELERRVAERTQDVRLEAVMLRAALGVSQEITAVLDVDDLVRRTVGAIRERFSFACVGLFLVNYEKETVDLRAAIGESGDTIAPRGQGARIGQGKVGLCAANGQSRLTSEEKRDLLLCTDRDAQGTMYEALVPMRSRGRTIGVLVLQDDRLGAFDEEAVYLLQVLADLLAAAVGNARLYEEAQMALETAQRSSEQITREGWQRVLHRSITGYQVTPQGQIQPVDGPWKVEMEEARLSDHIVRGDHMVSIPIPARGQAIGAVRLLKAASAPDWTDREVALAQAIVEQLGIALDSARLHQDAQQSAARERVAREVTDQLRATIDWDELMQTAVREIGRAVQASRVYVQWVPPKPVETALTPPSIAARNGDAEEA